MKTSYYLVAITFFLLATPIAFGAPEKVEIKKDTIVLNVDKYSESISKEVSESWLTRTNTFSLSQTAKSEFENTDYCPVDKIFCDLTLTAQQKNHIRLVPGVIANEKMIQTYLEDLARKVNRDAEDAKFTVENGKVSTFLEAKEGIALDVEKSLLLITQQLERGAEQDFLTMNLPYESTKPSVNYADVNDLGISSLIGEGTSNFKGSTVNRIKNIKIAVDRFNGTLIKPGEEFSFVKILGEVDAEHGYFPELVIKKNITELDFGGGVCQVSTTVFRAAIYSGLKITARRNHAYPVSYYSPQGMDSTVFVPNPDLRFMNNTPNHILIQAKINGTELKFFFYGTDDGRKIEVDGPHITERQPDGSLKTTFTQLVLDKNGKQLLKDVFNSSYDSPYRYPHPGGDVLTVKPANWSEDEWKAYKKTAKELAKTAAAGR